MPQKSIIAAIDENNAIGYNNKLLCHLPSDLQHFKSLTEGHAIIMGRKTFESLPNGALPNRRNIVISRDKELQFRNCIMASSIEEVMKKSNDEKEIFFIGGGEIYNQTIDLADKLYLTIIHHKFEESDAFFPKIDKLKWEIVEKETHQADEKNGYAYTFVCYKKIKRE